MSTIMLSRIDQEVDYFADRSQSDIDEAADREYDRYIAAESTVTFSEVLEELADISDADQAEFMQCVSDADRRAVSALFVMIDRAKDRVIARRLAEGEQRDH